MPVQTDPQFIVDKERLVTRIGKVGGIFNRKERLPWDHPTRVERRKKIKNGLLVVLAVVVFSAVLAMCVGSKVGL